MATKERDRPLFNKNTPYSEIWEWFKGRYLGPGNSEFELRRIHNKWKKLASEVK